MVLIKQTTIDLCNHKKTSLKNTNETGGRNKLSVRLIDVSKGAMIDDHKSDIIWPQPLSINDKYYWN